MFNSVGSYFRFSLPDGWSCDRADHGAAERLGAVLGLRVRLIARQAIRRGLPARLSVHVERSLDFQVVAGAAADSGMRSGCSTSHGRVRTRLRTPIALSCRDGLLADAVGSKGPLGWRLTLYGITVCA